jgi:hypothetical protein
MQKHFLAFTTIIILVVLAASCSKLCHSGYEGSRCNVLTTAKFEGTWNAVDTPGNLTYKDTITAGAVINDIIISSSFAGHQFNHVINASVLGNAITIPLQRPDTTLNYVQGTGTISSDHNSIYFTYQLISGDSQQVITSYTGTWNR